MKKNIFILLPFYLFAFLPFVLTGQTIVPTEPSNRNLVIEEFTGKSCGICPQSHLIVYEIENENPGRINVIKIHNGNPAVGTPNYTTMFGDPLWNQAIANGSSTGYPGATLNRQKFPGINTMGGSDLLYGRFMYEDVVTACLAQPSCANIASKATIDWSNRKITVLVEVYYTGNSTITTNKVNVALVQNNIIGPQDGSNFFEEMVEPGGMYRHRQTLRHLLTGQWGVSITPTTTGTFWTQTFEYTIPEALNNVPVVLGDLEVVAFVAEGNAMIITGNKAEVIHINNPEIFAEIDGLYEISLIDCKEQANAYLKVKNIGTQTITSLDLTYKVANGATENLHWNARSIPYFGIDTIELPMLEVVINTPQTLVTQIVKVNGTVFTSVSKSIIIHKRVGAGIPAMFILATDKYATETTFKIYKPDGTILLEGGPWSDEQGVVIRDFDFVAPVWGCYKIEVKDDFGDGINCGFGAGYFKVVDALGNTLVAHDGIFATEASIFLQVGTSYAIAATAGVNGTISPAGTTHYVEGASVTYTMTPRTNYEINELKVDGIAVTNPQLTYTFENITTDHTIAVTFRVIIGIDEKQNSAIKISPNPITDVMNILGDYDNLEIISSTGQIVCKANGEKSLKVSHLPKGIYFVKIMADGQIITHKIVK